MRSELSISFQLQNVWVESTVITTRRLEVCEIGRCCVCVAGFESVLKMKIMPSFLVSFNVRVHIFCEIKKRKLIKIVLLLWFNYLDRKSETLGRPSEY